MLYNKTMLKYLTLDRLQKNNFQILEAIVFLPNLSTQLQSVYLSI